MTYADKVKDWKANNPQAHITIGRYTLTFSYENSYESQWATCWICVESVMYELDWDDTPESIYFEEIHNKLKSGMHDPEYIDEILEVMKENPFTTQD